MAAALAAAGIALGGSAGACGVAAAAGLVVGELRREDVPRDDRIRVAQVEGTICSPWRVRRTTGQHSAALCTDWLRHGRRVSLRPPSIRLELASAVDPPPPGTVIRARGVLSRSAGFANRHGARPPGPWRLRVKSSRVVERVRTAGRLFRIANRVHREVDAAIRRASGGRTGGGEALARAYVLGDESELDDDLRVALRRAGLAHLLAVSGFNVSLVALAVGWLVAGRWRPARFALPLVAVWLYPMAAGPEPSLLRAVVTTSLALTLLASRRGPWPLQALAVGSAGLGLLAPELVGRAGFRLSVGATAGLLLFTRRWSARWTRLPQPLADLLAATLAAQVGALPVSVGTFGELSPMAPLANLLAVPWAALWMGVSLVWVALAVAWPGAAGATASLLDAAIVPFRLLDRLPQSPWVSVGIGGGWPVGAAISLAVVLAMERPRSARLALIALPALLCGGATSPDRPLLEVAFLDVGQGDAVLISGRETLLVDGGGLLGVDLGAAVLRPELEGRGRSRVDVAIVSHVDRDHCDGVVQLSRRMPVREVWITAGDASSSCGRALARRSGRVRELSRGDRIERPDGTWEVLHPGPLTSRRRATPDNARSLVFRATLGGRRFLFTGDLASADERRLVGSVGERALRCDVLKVAHHGSSGSSSERFLDAARPRWAVASAGVASPFGHPAPAAVARIESAGARLLSTSRSGAIELVLGGGRGWVLRTPGAPRTVADPR